MDPGGEVTGRGQGLARFIRSARDELMHAWKQAVRTLPRARELSEPALSDHLPHLLDRVVDLLEGAGVPASASTLHALSRLDVGFDLGSVAAEYALLRQVVLAQYGQRNGGHIFLDELEPMLEALDQAVGQAIQQYTRTRERTFVALDRMAQAGLEAEHTGELLRRLLEALVQSVPSVDTAEVMLRDGDRLRARAAVGLDEDLAGPFSVRIGEGFLGRVAAERRPASLRNASVEPELGPTLPARGVRALHAEPLVRGSELVGVAHIGSVTAVQFGDEDRLIFRAMADRAALLIAQAELHARLDQERSLLQSVLQGASGSAIVACDAQGLVTAFNIGAERLLGARAEEVVGRAHLQHLHDPEELAARARELALPPGFEVFANPALSGQAEPREWTWLCRDGRRRVILLTVTPRRGQAGELLGFVAVGHDVTERRRVERELSRSEREHRQLAESMPQIVWTADDHGRFDYVNQVFVDYTGAPAEQAYGEGWSRFVHPDDVDAAVHAWRAAVRDGGPFQLEIRLRRRDGQYRWFLARARGVPIPASAGRRWLGTTTDVHDLKRAQAELRARAELGEQLVGIVSHDLRNPVTAIATSAATLLRRDDLDERMRRGLGRILSATDRVSRMIRDLLDFTQARLGQGIPISRRALDLRALAEQVVDEVLLAHPRRRIELTAEGDARGAWDPDRLAQVVTNLLVNAVQHGAPDLPVTVHVAAEGPEVRISVHNAGAPIPPEVLPRIFEPMRRGERSGADGEGRSVGLGLYIVRQLVHAHGGTVQVSSGPSERSPHSSGEIRSKNSHLRNCVAGRPSQVGQRSMLAVLAARGKPLKSLERNEGIFQPGPPRAPPSRCGCREPPPEDRRAQAPPSAGAAKGLAPPSGKRAPPSSSSPPSPASTEGPGCRCACTVKAPAHCASGPPSKLPPGEVKVSVPRKNRPDGEAVGVKAPEIPA